MSTRKEEIAKAFLRHYGVRMDDDGRWITTENGHKVHLNEEGDPDIGNKHVIEKMTGGKSSTQSTMRGSRDTRQSKRALQDMVDTSGWYARLEDLEKDLTDSGFSIEDSNRDYIVVSDNSNEQDTQFELRLGGTERTITVDDIRVEKMPDSDDDYEEGDDEEEEDDY